MCDKTNNIYEIDECDYCGNRGVIVRPSPFLVDNGAKMCEHCWNETQKEYIHSTGEYIPNFKDVEMGYDKIEKEYDDFESRMDSDYWGDWEGSEVECPTCGHKLKINCVDYD